MVVKKDGRREDYDRNKIISGLRTACKKRKISAETLEKITDDIERMLIESGRKEVESKVIGEEVMRALRNLDQVAYVRFASVYRQFKDVKEFMQEVKGLFEK